MPNRKAGSVFSQSPPMKRASRNAFAIPAEVIGSGGVSRGTAARTAKRSARIPTVANDVRIPTSWATPPKTGPSTAPETPAATLKPRYPDRAAFLADLKSAHPSSAVELDGTASPLLEINVEPDNPVRKHGGGDDA